MRIHRILVCLLALTTVVGIALAQDQTLESDGDLTLLNDVEIEADGSLRRGVDKALINDVDVQVLPPVPGQSSGRWIGVGVAPIPDVLRSHLHIADGVGVMVDQVVPSSPAADAGLNRHDVLIAAGGSAVSQVQDLIAAVASISDGESLELKWIRAGQEMTATVVPAERPKSMQLGNRNPAVDVDPRDLGRLRDWLGRLEQGGRGNLPGRLRMRMQPGQNSNAQVFQNSISVQIQRDGSGPAKIKVQKDGDSWELTEDDLGELPDDVRVQVESMLNGGGLQLGGRQGLRMQGLDNVLDGLPDIQRMMQDLDGALKGFDGFGSRFDDMDRQMERMFDQMRELRSQQQQLIPAEELEEGDEA